MSDLHKVDIPEDVRIKLDKMQQKRDDEAREEVEKPAVSDTENS